MGEETTGGGLVVAAVVLLEVGVTLGQTVNTQDIHVCVTIYIGICY